MLEIGLAHYLTVAAILFTLGLMGIFLNRKNVIVILMSIELMLLAVNINLVSFSTFLQDLVGQIFAMLLVIDSGNTNVVFAVYKGEEQIGTWRCGNDPKRTADEYAVWLSQLLKLNELSFDAIEASIIASVVPETLFNLKRFCDRYVPGRTLVVKEPGTDLGIDILIDRPEQVGADRLVGVIAAHTHYGGPLMVLDFGTATSFDIADADGNFCGGVLAPGVHNSVEALHMGASRAMVLRVFFITGSSVGILGTTVGALIGIAFASNIETVRNWIEGAGGGLFAAEIRFLANLPAKMDGPETALIIAIALGLSFLASIYPAWRAASLDPVEVLRYA